MRLFAPPVRRRLRENEVLRILTPPMQELFWGGEELVSAAPINGDA